MFYHISSIDHGESFKFKPRIPRSSLISKEGNIPRICVAPSVYYCLCSIAGCSPLDFSDIVLEFKSKDGAIVSPSVYTTEEIPFIPPNASDFKKNNERWFLKPTIMKRVGYLDLLALSVGSIQLMSESKNFDLDINIKTIIRYRHKVL